MRSSHKWAANDKTAGPFALFLGFVSRQHVNESSVSSFILEATAGPSLAYFELFFLPQVAQMF